MLIISYQEGEFFDPQELYLIHTLNLINEGDILQYFYQENIVNRQINIFLNYNFGLLEAKYNTLINTIIISSSALPDISNTSNGILTSNY